VETRCVLGTSLSCPDHPQSYPDPRDSLGTGTPPCSASINSRVSPHAIAVAARISHPRVALPRQTCLTRRAMPSDEAVPAPTPAAPSMASAIDLGSLTHLKDFVVAETLQNHGDNRLQQMVLLGRFTWQAAGNVALIKIAPKELPASAGAAALEAGLDLSCTSYSGKEYAYFSALPPPTGGWDVEVIAPASAKQVDRSRPAERALVRETPALYADRVMPYLRARYHVGVEKLPVGVVDPLGWLFEILAGRKETERVLHNDAGPDVPDGLPGTGFLLNVDTKARGIGGGGVCVAWLWFPRHTRPISCPLCSNATVEDPPRLQDD